MSWAVVVVFCVNLDLAAMGHGAFAQAPLHPAAEPACPVPHDSPVLRYANPRWGFALAYPSAFRLDPDSVPENGDTARFSTPDRSATAVVTALRNEPTEPLSGLLREAERDILENSRGTITYRRATRDWFVLSGHVGGRIYYRRSFLAREGRIIATLWIEFPRDMRPCFEEAVTVMSLSFRPDPG